MAAEKAAGATEVAKEGGTGVEVTVAAVTADLAAEREAAAKAAAEVVRCLGAAVVARVAAVRVVVVTVGAAMGRAA